MLLVENIQIRPAVRQDVAAMMALIRELADFEREPDAVTVSLDHFAQSGFGPQPVWWAFNAFHNEELVGMALYYIRYSTWKGQMMYLEDIVITEKWRSKGIGSLLMAQLIDEAGKRQLKGISWQVLNWNADAINFYKKYPVRMDEGWINVHLAH